MLAPLANFFGSSLLSRKFLANKGMGMIMVEWSQSKFMINNHFLLSMQRASKKKAAPCFSVNLFLGIAVTNPINFIMQVHIRTLQPFQQP